ncbi:MAG: type II toxin-antitoxin system RelE/ParE family toxin [Phaeodactylibacter sp.]|nr:type II toxin-antitoxin system RelE/ParE family toxin [Phaeodactylibacter sp.]
MAAWQENRRTGKIVLFGKRSNLSSTTINDKNLVEYSERLQKHPESCAPCRNAKLKNAGFRCCKYRKRVIIYEVAENSVDILAVIHSKRGPKDFEKVLEG